MQVKKDTSGGFQPTIPLGPDVTAPDRAVLRLDGALDASVLSPAVHLVLLSMARLRNVVSTLRIENVPVDLSGARHTIETGEAFEARDRHVLRTASAYGRIHDTPQDQLAEPSLGLVRDLHKNLMAEMVPDDELGRFKTEPNGVMSLETGRFIFEATPPDRTEAELDALFAWYQEARDVLPPVVTGAVFFAEFEAIHPFHDGNGRVGRMLNIHILKRLGLENVALVPLDDRFFATRDKYYEKLASTNDGETWFVWARYYADQLKKAYTSAVRRGDLHHYISERPQKSARDVLEWILTRDTTWFRHGDYPNPSDYGPATVSKVLRNLVAEGVLEARGQKKGREYRLGQGFLERIYSPGDTVT